MEEFNTIEKVKELFKSINALGSDNIFFVACQDKQKVSGMVAGMEYPYDGLLINDSEKGIGMFYLKAGALSGLMLGEMNPVVKEGYNLAKQGYNIAEDASATALGNNPIVKRALEAAA